ncbi:MAG: CHAP domain-containing protein [Oscillibacter sp.]|jgi:hypothetical protein|nr:CHAP domain-containing protein [Oscillibacter sp.]
MADFAALTIPMDTVERITLHVTDRKKTLRQVKAETGADYLLNGTLYDLKTGAVNCWLKADGVVLKNAGYNVLGFAWDTGPDLTMENVKTSQKANFIACTTLIAGGKKLPKLTYDSGQGGKRGRSAIGLKQGRLALYCTRDGSAAARTPEGLRDDLAAAGWESAVMLDGGASSQCDFSGTVVRSSARKVQHWICVWVRHPAEQPDENSRKRARVLAAAAGEIGVKESPPGSNRVKYNDDYYGRPVSGAAYPWCMVFVWWVFARAGLPLPVKTASCGTLAGWAKAHGQWVTGDFRPGDIALMDFGGKVIRHVGIVEQVLPGGDLVTVEGNTSLSSDDNGGAVMRRGRPAGWVAGAYRPGYNQ